MASDAGLLLQQARPGTQTAGRAELPGPPDLWGGLECSVVRIGESWRDQVCETGHHARGTSDLDRITGLGITTLRYPVLWERVAAGGDTGWAWHDRQLGHLRRSGVTVIAGLDWDSLLRERRGRLEPGAFDTRIDPPRPTEIAAALESLTREGSYLDSCLEQPGWWRRDDRFRAGGSA